MKRLRYDWWWKETCRRISQMLTIDIDGAGDVLDQYIDRIDRDTTPAEAARMVRQWEECGVC